MAHAFLLPVCIKISHAMLFTVLWVLLGLFFFWLFFQSVEFFEKI